MSPLDRLIRAEIEAAGPISVARYMALCLGHPEHGYYATRDPLGQAGDFTTAPEVSQMFGEMIGLWLVERWQAMGGGSTRLVELGPGRGTLMADALRVGARAGFAPDLWFVETSPALRAAQAERVPHAQWAERLADVPEGPALILANEFFDALPVHQFLATPEGWRERQIGLVGGALAWGLSAPLPGGPGPLRSAALSRCGPPATKRPRALRSPSDCAAAPGWAERSPMAEAVASEIAARVRAGGAALLIDYGYGAADRPPGPTLQAVRAHRKADPLHAPGEADLTWLIDLDALAGEFRGLETWHTTQGAFLARLGIGQRAAQLAAARPDQAEAVADALERLTGPDQMGTLFKVLAAVPPGRTAPPGFEDAP